MKRIVSVLLAIIIVASVCCIGADAASVTMKDFLSAYKSGDFTAAENIAAKLPKKAKSYNSNMSAKMKDAYLKKIMSTNNADTYYLADITGDKKPELFLKKGTCEADYKIYVFKYSNGKAKRIGKTWGGHTHFADYPGENAVILIHCHMGYEALSLIKYSNGKAKIVTINNRDCQNISYTPVPYTMKYYYCGTLGKYNLSPFTAKNTKAVRAARGKLNKLVKRINPVIFNYFPKTRKLTLSPKNKTIFAAISMYKNNHKSYTVGIIDRMKKSYIKKECKDLFGSKPNYKSLSRKYKKHSKSSVGSEVNRNGNSILINAFGVYYFPSSSLSFYDFALPKTAKVECIAKTKQGYRIAVAHYMTGYYQFENPDNKGATYAHTLIDVKKNSKSKYKYVITKINSVTYCNK